MSSTGEIMLLFFLSKDRLWVLVRTASAENLRNKQQGPEAYQVCSNDDPRFTFNFFFFFFFEKVKFASLQMYYRKYKRIASKYLMEESYV